MHLPIGFYLGVALALVAWCSLCLLMLDFCLIISEFRDFKQKSWNYLKRILIYLVILLVCLSLLYHMFYR